MLRKVRTENGWVQGIEAADPRVTAFKGVPFAAPPIGENRWRAPQPAKDWEGTRQAFRFAPISMQSTPGLGTDVYCKEWHVDPDIDMDEDCLYLNIWTPAKKEDEKLPVLVWFFGGSLQWGYTSEMEMDGENLAKRGIVVVTVNYRLNCFGFLSHPELTKESPKAPTNFGFLDQQAGLRWVTRNIEAFGGDSKNVTIAGQSAGGGSVLAQMTCPENYGLFQKAVVFSAMIRSPYKEFEIGIPEPLEEAEKLGEKFFEALGVKTLAQARELDAKTIRDCYDKFMWENRMMLSVMDGQVYGNEDPIQRFAHGKYGDVPVMSGNTEDEFLNHIPVHSEEEWKQECRRLFGERAEEFMAMSAAQVKVDAGYSPVNGIECTVKKVFHMNEESKKPNDCYYYRFDVDIPGEDHPGTFHSVDLWFFFETLAKCWRPFEGKHYDIARQMCDYYANFIKTGNPNGKDLNGNDLPRWEPYKKEKPMEMTFTLDGAKPGVEEKIPFKEFLKDFVEVDKTF